MEIAPGIDATEWTRLELSKNDCPDWKRAIEIVRIRFEARYFEPVDRLIEHEKSILSRMPRYGFIVLAIDCLLIEALQAFIEGRTDTRGHSPEMFLRFLTSREQFKKDFDEKLARRFYQQIRCGILHQAETRKWRVWAFGPLLQDKGEQMILNRTEFHSRLKSEFDTYLSALTKGITPKLRSNLKKKMDHICTN